MANDYIDVEHICGHTEEHHFTDSSKMNKRKAAWKVKEKCSDCLEKDAQGDMDKENVEVLKSFPNLPELEGVSKKQIKYGTNMRLKALGRIATYLSRVKNKIEEAYKDDRLTNSEHDHFIKAIAEVIDNKSAKFWIESPDFTDYSTFIDLLAHIVLEQMGYSAEDYDEELEERWAITSRRFNPDYFISSDYF